MNEHDVEFWTSAIDRVFAAAPGRSPSGESLDEVRRDLLPEVQRRTGEVGAGDIAWLTAGLGQPGMGLGVAVFFERLGWMPEVLFEPMIEAALGHAQGEAENAARPFIAACRTSVGLRRINEVLLDRLERGSEAERLPAARALRFSLPNDGDVSSLGDVGDRRKRVLLTRFVETDDPALRCALAAQLDLERWGADGSLVALVERARQVVRQMGE